MDQDDRSFTNVPAPIESLPIHFDESRYPRPKWISVIRSSLRLWWVAFAIYPANVIFNIYSIVGNSGLAALPAKLREALLLTQFLLLWRTSKWTLIPWTTVAIALVAAGRWAMRDREREKIILQRRFERISAEQNHSSLVAAVESAAENAAHRQTAATAKGLASAISETLVMHLATRGVLAPDAIPQSPPFDDCLLGSPEHFVGRSAEVEWVLRQLEFQTGAIVSLTGMGGIGKTSLAAVAVSSLRKRDKFKDGVGLVLCQNSSDPIDVIKRALARFDSHRRQPQANDLIGLTDTARQLLRDRDALIILDNVEPDLPVANVLAVLRAGSASLLLTSRQVLAGGVIPAESTRKLDILSEQEAIELFAFWQGSNTGSYDAETSVLSKKIVTVLGRHTLAVKLAGAYAADTRRDLAVMASDLEQDPLSTPEGETPRALAVVLEQSLDQLHAQARLYLSALAVFAPGDFGRKAALALNDALGLEYPDEVVAKLVLRGLVDSFVNPEMPTSGDRERLRMHPLVYALISRNFKTCEMAFQAKLQSIWTHWYANFVTANSNHHRTISFEDDNIAKAIEWSCHNDPLSFFRLCLGLRSFWLDRWRTAAAMRYLPRAIQTNREICENDQQLDWGESQVRLSLAYGQVLWRVGQVVEAEKYLMEGLKTLSSTVDVSPKIEGLHALGELRWRSGQLDEARQEFEAALELARQVADVKSQALLLRNIGRLHRDQAQTEVARSYFEQALELATNVSSLRDQGRASHELGVLAFDQGAVAEADTRFSEALDAARKANNRRDEGSALVRLGCISQVRGDLKEAEQLYREGLALYLDTQDRLAYGWALRMLATVLLDQGEIEEAQRLCAEGIKIAKAAGDQRNEGQCLTLLARLSLARGNCNEALTECDRALALARFVGNRRNEATISALRGEIAVALGYNDEAIEHYRQAVGILRDVKDHISIGPVSLKYALLLHQYTHDHVAARSVLQAALSLCPKEALDVVQGLKAALAELASGEENDSKV